MAAGPAQHQKRCLDLEGAMQCFFLYLASNGRLEFSDIICSEEASNGNSDTECRTGDCSQGSPHSRWLKGMAVGLV